MNEQVILVDEQNNEIGVMPKLEAHQNGILHRAFSIFIFNSKNELLLQQRAFGKYHSAGLWSNTCCSHPSPGESTADAVSRRLKQEMGMACNLTPAFSFIYHATFNNGLIEHEYDSVYFGTSDVMPVINKDEVNDWKYISTIALQEDININSSQYTEWLKHCLENVIKHHLTIKQ